MNGAKWKVSGFLLLAMALGFALRVYQLPDETPWWDEIVCLRHLDAPSLTAFIADVRQDDPPMTPIYFTTAYLWAQAVSDSVVSMRLLSVLFSIASIPLLFAFTRLLFDTRAGLVSAYAFSISLVHIYFAQEVRTYAFITFFALLSAYTLARALREDRGFWWIAHIATNALLTFTHLFSAVLFGVEGLILLCLARSRPRMVSLWFAVHLLLALLLATWLRTVDMTTIHRAANWMVAPGVREAAVALNILAGGRFSNENPARHLPGGLSLDWLLAALIYGVIAWFVVESLRRRNASTAFSPAVTSLALVAWLVLPLCVLGVASFVWRPCFVYRYVLYSSLALCTLFGAGVSAIPRPWARRTVLACFALMACYQLTAIGGGPFRPDWRGAGEHIEARLQPADTVIAFQPLNQVALEYNSLLPRAQIMGAQVWSEVCDAIPPALEKGGAVWVAVWLWTPPTKFEDFFRSQNLAVESTDFQGWPNVRVYRVRPGS